MAPGGPARARRQPGWTRFLLIALLLLAGCGTASPAGPATATPQRGPARGQPADKQPPVTTIVWSFWGDDKQVEINQRIITAFHAVHPEIRVQTQHEPWPTYFQRLTDGWARGEAPDIMFINNIPVYARTGALENLEAYIARDRYDIADFYPALLEIFRHQGALYGLPRDNDTKVIYYNKQLLAAAGLSAPRPDWTWSEFRELARQLTRRDATGTITQYGFAYEARLWWRLWVWQNNGHILDDHFQPTRVRLGEPAAVDALQFLADLTVVDRVTPPYEQLQQAVQRTLFREGKLAMMLDNHSFVPTAAQTPELEWDVAPLPRGQRRANLTAGAGYAISSSSAHKEAAWTFLKFLVGTEGQALFAESGVAVPARRTIREENIFLRQKPYNARVFLDETEHGMHTYYFPRAAEMDAYLDAGLAPVFQGQERAAAAVQRMLPHLTELVAASGP